jgi:hypothetical protein
MSRVRNDLKKTMPWYTALLGAKPEGEEFARLLSQFKLSSVEAYGGVPWYENDELGVSVSISGGRIDAVQFFSSENPHFKGFPGQLPLGLSFEMTRDEVRKLLGDPDDVFPERTVGTVRHRGIDRYYVTQCCTVAVCYSAKTGRVEVLGFERPRSEP